MTTSSTTSSPSLSSKSAGNFPMTILLLLAPVVCFVLGYWNILGELVASWDSGENSYCYLVIPMFVYLCWEKRKVFRFFEFSWSLLAIPAFAFAILLIALGELGSIITLAHAGLWLILVALGLSCYGFKRLRHLWFELLILLFIVPLPPFLIRTFTFNMKVIASTLSVKMMRFSGIIVYQDGNIIDLGFQQLQVVDACSGLRYIMPMFLITLLIGHFYAKGGIRQFLLLTFVLPVAIFINSFRIYFTAILSVNGYPELADNFFHDFAGVVMFIAAGAILFLVTYILNHLGPKPAAAENALMDQGGRPAKGSGAFACIVISCLLLLGTGHAIERLPVPRPVPAKQSMSSFPLEIDGWQGTRETISEEILAELWSDDYAKITFTKNSHPGQRIYMLIPYYTYQGTSHTAHAPQSCLLGGGWSLTSSADREVVVGDDTKITVRRMLLKKGVSNVVSSYFFFGRGRVVTNPWLNKLYLLWDAFSQHRTDGAMVRVEMVLADNTVNETVYEDLDRFIGELWKILPRYIPR